MKPVKVWYLFNRPRAPRQRMVLAGRWPEEGMYGFNRLEALGYDTRFSDEGHLPTLLRWGSKRIEDLLSDRGRKVGFNLGQAWTLRKKLNQADLIFATADSSALGALALKALGLIRPPVVYATIGLVEGFEKDRGPAFEWVRRLIRHADRVIYYGHQEGPLLQRLFQIPESRLCFVPFCVESRFFNATAARDGNPLAVGLDHRRDWPLLFQAAQQCPFAIDLVCNPDTLQGLTVPPNVNPIAPLPMMDLREKISSAAFVILPVRQNAYTGATITLLQSMAAGCATIVTRTGAIETGYDFFHRENCLMVSPGDPDELAEAMNLLFGDPGLCREIGQNARRTVSEKYDIDHYAARLDAIFRQAQNKGGVDD